MTEMEKRDYHHGDSDSANSPTGNGKIRHVPLEAIPDPDDRLSAEERAKIVLPLVRLASRVQLTVNSGSQTPMETRPQIDTMALPALPRVFPGSYQHRQCQNRWPHKRSAHDWFSIQFDTDNLLHFLRRI